MADRRVPPGHRAGRRTVLAGVLLALAGIAAWIVAGGPGGRLVAAGAAVMSWSWNFLWIF